MIMATGNESEEVLSIQPMAFTTMQNERIILEAAVKGEDLIFHIFPKREYFKRSSEVKQTILLSFDEIKLRDSIIEYVSASDGIVPVPACLDLTGSIEDDKMVYKKINEEDIPKESFFVRVPGIGSRAESCSTLCERIMRDL
jgi:hypothetical protein